jgi:hypothetical protein
MPSNEVLDVPSAPRSAQVPALYRWSVRTARQSPPRVPTNVRCSPDSGRCGAGSITSLANTGSTQVLRVASSLGHRYAIHRQWRKPERRHEDPSPALAWSRARTVKKRRCGTGRYFASGCQRYRHGKRERSKASLVAHCSELAPVWPSGHAERQIKAGVCYGRVGSRHRPSRRLVVSTEEALLAIFRTAVIGLLACTIISRASPAAGNEESSGVHWLRKCTNPEPSLQMECAIYVRALVEYDEVRAKMLGQKRFICPHNDLTVGQSREVVLKFLREKPESLHQPFVLLAHLALQAAYPCTGGR